MNKIIIRIIFLALPIYSFKFTENLLVVKCEWRRNSPFFNNTIPDTFYQGCKLYGNSA